MEGEGSARAASRSGSRGGWGGLLGPWAALHCPQHPGVARAVVTHPGVLWQCSTWPRGPQHPLSPPQSCRAAGVLPVQPVRCSSCSTGRHCGTVPVPARGHVVRIMARQRRWPLGNQVSIWPRSGPGFPIPALISGMARYYSYHNNIPVLGSPLRLLQSGSGEDEDGESQTVALATQQPPALPWLCVGHPKPLRTPPPKQGWAQNPAELGYRQDHHLPGSCLVQVPMSWLSCPP